MALQTSGQISLNDVNTELGNASGTSISLGSTAVRDLFGIASGEIQMSDGYGASAASGTSGMFMVDTPSTGTTAEITWLSAGNHSLDHKSSEGTPWIVHDFVTDTTTSEIDSSGSYAYFDLYNKSDLSYEKTIKVALGNQHTGTAFFKGGNVISDQNNLYLAGFISNNTGATFYHGVIVCVNISTASVSWVKYADTGSQQAAIVNYGIRFGDASSGFSKIGVNSAVSGNQYAGLTIFNASTGSTIAQYGITNAGTAALNKYFNSNDKGFFNYALTQTKNSLFLNEIRTYGLNTSSHYETPNSFSGSRVYFECLVPINDTEFYALHFQHDGNHNNQVGLIKVNMSTLAISYLKSYTMPFNVADSSDYGLQRYPPGQYGVIDDNYAYFSLIDGGNHYVLGISLTNNSTVYCYKSPFVASNNPNFMESTGGDGIVIQTRPVTNQRDDLYDYGTAIIQDISSVNTSATVTGTTGTARSFASQSVTVNGSYSLSSLGSLTSVSGFTYATTSSSGSLSNSWFSASSISSPNTPTSVVSL